jgi:predicted RNA-binding protein with PIN domain
VPVIRILVDGYSLLHSFPELAQGKPRHSAVARAELIAWLTQYADATGVPVTVFFDGAGAPQGTPKPISTPEMEILYSGKGETADDLIERVAHRFSKIGEVMVVTDDYAERDTVESSGALASSCLNFISTVQATLDDFQRQILARNRREMKKFKGAGK